MKIKIVCELSGLSDRTIRYYIDEGLISPSYTENYMGRKNYDFSQKDIKELNDIAVLRKFDFTIEEIKAILNDPQASKAILGEVKTRTEATALDCREKLVVLSTINDEQAYSVAELAEKLSEPSLALPVHDETITSDFIKKSCSLIKACLILAIVWLPIVFSLCAVVSDVSNYCYPVFNRLIIVATVVSLLPSIAVLVISKIKFVYWKIVRNILLVLCILSIPVSTLLSSAIILESETTDFQNYREFDADCLANRNVVFQEFFPAWPHYFENTEQEDGTLETVYLDANYHYHYHEGFDYTYDIYAEWPLNKDEYIAEVHRVTDLFHNSAINKIYNYKLSERETENFQCLILYRGDDPFNPVTESYDYLIFAYNEETHTVRYINCSSLENGEDQPYYLFLDW